MPYTADLQAFAKVAVSMVQVHLRKILNREVKTVIQSLVAMHGGHVSIQDNQGLTLMGTESEIAHRYPITVAETVMGWVVGGPEVAPVASFLSVLAAKEYETRSLAQKVLDSYREMNLVCKIAEKLVSCPDREAVAQLAVKEAHRLHPEGIAVLLWLNRSTSLLRPLATLGQPISAAIPLGQGILGQIALAGTGEIVNEVRTDPRFTPTDLPTHALVCAPLKMQEQVMALLCLWSEDPHTYQTEHLMVLEAIAAQTAPALERALQYSNQQQLKQRDTYQKQPTMAFRVEVDEATRRDQLSQIIDSEFFQQLEERAEEFRSSMNS